VHQLEDLLRRLGRLQSQCARRTHDTFRMEVKVRAAALESAAAVEHHRAQPEGVVARAQDGGIALVPGAVPVGERVHSSRFSGRKPALLADRSPRGNLTMAEKRRKKRENSSGLPETPRGSAA